MNQEANVWPDLDPISHLIHLSQGGFGLSTLHFSSKSYTVGSWFDFKGVNNDSAQW